MSSAGDDRIAGESAAFLAEAYPDERERVRDVRWLAWLAWYLGAKENLAWWDIPAWTGPRRIRIARVLTGTLAMALAFGVPSALLVPRAGAPAAIAAAGAAGWVGAKLRPGRLRRAPWPQVLVPRWPRSRREGAVLAAGLSTGVWIRPVLIRMWVRPVPADAAPDGSYRASRRSTVLDGVACVLTGLPAALLAFVWGPAMLAVAGVLTGIALLAALADGKLPAVKLASLVLLTARHRWVRWNVLLSRAAARHVLRVEGAYYQFRDSSMREYLAAVHQADVNARARRIPDAVAAATAKGGVRPRLLAVLSSKTIVRIAIDLGLGAWIAVIARALTESASPLGGRIGLGVAGGLVTACCGALLAGLVLTGLVAATRWSLWVTSRMPDRVRLAVLACLVEVACLLTLLAGAEAIRHCLGSGTVVLLPAAVVAGVGGWVCVLVDRRWHGAPGRRLRLFRTKRGPVQFALGRGQAADALLALVSGGTLLQLMDRHLPGAQASAGLLFPVAVWLSVRAWRAMNGSSRFAVKALADIGVSLLLGASVVLLLVWLASLLRMPPAEVAVVHGAVTRAGEIIDLPWWVWLSLFTALSGASLAFAVWAGKLHWLDRWFERLHVVPAAVVSRRVLASVHIGLLVTVLIGLAAPPAVGTLLRDRLAAAYTETLTADLRARGELVAYQEIRRSFSGRIAPAVVVPLVAMVIEIDDISKPPAGDHDATETERDLAARLGSLQAVALALGPTPQVASASAADAEQAGFDSSVADAADLSERTGELIDEDKADDAAERHVDQAAELAATAVSEALRIPRIGDVEVVQIIREYLMSLVENSPLKDTFAAWAGRLTESRAGHKAPPAAEDIVVPDPEKLAAAAATAATSELASTPVIDPGAVQRILGESAMVAAVDLTNQVRYLQEGDGPCAGCAQPEPPQDQPGQDDHPEAPDFGG